MCFIVQPPFLLKAFGLSEAGAGSNGDYTLVLAAMVVAAVLPVVTRQTKEASWIEVEHVTNFLAVFVLNPIVCITQQFAKGESPLAMPPLSASEVGLIAAA